MDNSFIASSSTFNSDAVPVNWMSLPNEIWLEIFKKLPHITVMFVLRQVCKLFYQLVFDSTLWKFIDMNEWKTVANMRHLNLESDNIYEKEHDLKCLYDKLYLKGYVTSTELFLPIVKRTHSNIRAISFSRFDGDFVFEKPQQSILNKCCNLTYLNVAFCDEINQKTIKSICSHCTKLKTFVLEGCSKISDDAVKELSVLTCLQNLNVSHCAAITDEGISSIMLMPARLKQLFCDGLLHISDFGVMLLVQYQTLIEELSVDGEDLHDIAVASIIGNLPHLKSLEISFCNNLTDRTFSSIIKCPTIKMEALRMRQLSSKVTTPLVTQMFEQPNMSHLKHLTLTDCEAVVDYTLHAISITCTQLEDIRLDWCCNVTDGGLESLVQNCGNLSRLVLVGLKRLLGSWLSGMEVKLPKLKHLDLSQCDTIKDSDLYALVKRKPDMLAYTYFHEKVDISNVDDLIKLLHTTQEESGGAPGEVPCPASLGATLDF